MTCSIDECEKRVLARGWCDKHYKRWQKHGDPLIAQSQPKARACKHGDSTRTYRAPEYAAWRSMKSRCCDPRSKSYYQYGGRGITICEQWRKSYKQFLADVGRRPSPLHSLDRYPDNNGNYEPGNVRWATPEEQMRNTRWNRYLTINGETRCVSEWSVISGVAVHTIYSRLNKKWTPKDAVFIKPNGRNSTKEARRQKVLELSRRGLTHREIGKLIDPPLTAEGVSVLLWRIQNQQRINAN